MPRRKQPAIPDELLDQFLGGSDPRAALADGGLAGRAQEGARRPGAELDHHLDGGEPDGRANGRNGYGGKTVLTGTGRLDLQVPRDRLATFDPLRVQVRDEGTVRNKAVYVALGVRPNPRPGYRKRRPVPCFLSPMS